MTCRHASGDPNCSSSKNYRAPYEAREPATPDSGNYTIEDVARVGTHLVLKVKYPNCRECTYEGNKIMVFLDVSEADALRWRKIDPHFRDPKGVIASREAPSPVARFPGNAAGWCDAIAYAQGKVR